MGLEKIPGSTVFVGRKPESTKPFALAKVKTLFAVHLDADLQKEFGKKGIKVHIIPTIMDPEVSPKLIKKITTLANKSKGNVAFTCMAGAHVSNAYAGIYLAQKGWSLSKIMAGLDKVSVKTSHQHISPGLASGIMETIKFSHINYTQTMKKIIKSKKPPTPRKKAPKRKPITRRR
jgi:hypothetical protein